jgi:hypothetical protein
MTRLASAAASVDRYKQSRHVSTKEEAAMMALFSRLIMIALLWSVPLGAMAESSQPAAAPTQALLKRSRSIRTRCSPRR